MAVTPVPEGYHTLTPYLCVKGGAAAIEFYAQAFGASERMRLGAAEGKVSHAELQIGNSVVMLADEHPEMGFHGPGHHHGSPVHLHLYVEDVDAMYRRALDAGAIPVRPVADQFYGDRTGSVRDPFGHTWHLATRKEDLSQEEMAARLREMSGKADSGG
jgi:PhnB protein